MEYLFIYGLDLLGNFEGIVIVLIFMTLFLAAAFLIYTAVNWREINSSSEYDEDEKIAHNKFKTILIRFIVASILLSFLPSKRAVLLMGGVYYGKKAVNAVVTSDKLEKVNTIIDLQLDRYIKELKNE